MKNKNLQKLILELNKSSSKRNQEFILNYLKSLKPLMTFMKEKFENNESILEKLSTIMTHQKYTKSDMIVEYGQKWNNIYLILNGNVTIMTPTFHEYYMNEEEYIIYLLKLRKNNQKELLNHCIKYNTNSFSFTNESLSDFIFNSQKKKLKKGIILKNKNISNAAKDVIKHLKLNEEINDKQMKNITPEKYISLSEIDNEIVKNTKKIKSNDMDTFLLNYESERRLIKLPSFEKIYTLKEGEIFCENNMEYVNNRVNETVIALSDCDLVKINRVNYQDITKESLDKVRNEFLKLILSYKIFSNISYVTFSRKYYHYFKHLKMNKNQILFEEGNICDNIFFISKGEYELYIDKNIKEVNHIILKLKDIIDDLKKYILIEREKIIVSNIYKKDVYLKLKNNLKQFFNKFENEINLDEVVYNIRNELNKIELILDEQVDKIYSSKQRIKLGIFKNRQIIGLNDIVNRDEGNICLVNCKCDSFEGDLYYVPYNKFLPIYEKEDKVKLYTKELLFQNIYYIIKRLLFHKNYVIKNAAKKEYEFDNKLQNDIKKDDLTKNSIISKTKINFVKVSKTLQKEEKSNNNINYTNNSEENSDLKLKQIFSYFNKIMNEYSNISNKRSRIKIKNDRHKLSLSNKKEYKEEQSEESNIIKSTSRNNFRRISNKDNNELKNLKFIDVLTSRNFSEKVLSPKKTKLYGMNTVNLNTNIKIPTLVINDNEVKVNETKFHNKTNNDNFSQYVNYYKNNKRNSLINNNELKNLILFGNFSEKVEKKKNLNILRKAKNLILKRKRTCKSPKTDMNKKLFSLNIQKLKVTPFYDESKTNKIKENSFNNFDKSLIRRMQIKFIKHNIRYSNNFSNQDDDNNIKYNKVNIIFEKRSNIDLRNKTFNYDKKEYSRTNKNHFFRNSFLKKNVSDIPIMSETNIKEKNIPSKSFQKNRNIIYHLKNLPKNNRFIQTPNSFMNAFKHFQRRMEKLNIK